VDLAEEQLRGWQLRAQEQAARAQVLGERLKAATATASSSPDGVRVTVDSTGGLAALHLGAATAEMQRPALAALILRTSRQAQSVLVEQLAALATEVYGAGSATAQFVTDAYRERFPSLDDSGQR